MGEGMCSQKEKISIKNISRIVNYSMCVGLYVSGELACGQTAWQYVLTGSDYLRSFTCGSN